MANRDGTLLDGIGVLRKSDAELSVHVVLKVKLPGSSERDTDIARKVRQEVDRNQSTRPRNNRR